MPQIPRVLSSARSQSIEEGMNQQLSHLLAHIRAIEPVLNLDSLGFYSRFFVVLKKELGKWRAILDVSVLNSIFCTEGVIQNGNSTSCERALTKRGMNYFSRHDGCLQACIGASSIQKIPVVCLQGSGVSVPFTPYGSDYSSSGFNPAYQSDQGVFAAERGEDASVFR